MTPSYTIARQLSEQIYEFIATHKTLPWRQGWTSRTHNPLTNTFYKGINYFLTSMHMEEKKLQVPQFLTFNQIKTLGGSVKKGETSTPIIFFKSYIPRAKDNDIDNLNDIVSDNDQYTLGHKTISNEPKPCYFLRNYRVYGIEQSTLPQESYQNEQTENKSLIDHDRILRVLYDYLNREKIRVEFVGVRAFYHTTQDWVQVPRRENFQRSEDFYFTLAHELAHSTGHKDRLGRFQTSEEMDKGRRAKYSYEEIVADMTACLILTEVGITFDLGNSASYIEGWLKHWEDKKELLYRACRDAQKACEYIFNTSAWGNKQNVENYT